MSSLGHYGNDKLIITPGGKIGRCPGFQYEFSPYDCCCFLDPSPPAWNSGTVYPHLYAVKHNDLTWYSTIVGDNQGNEPGVDAGWTQYTHCDNEDWDSIPPFGGVGKTPKKYAFAVSGITVSRCENCMYIIDFSQTLSLEDYPYPVIDPHTGNFATYGKYCEANAYFGSVGATEGLWVLKFLMISSGKTKITISSGITPGLCSPAGIVFSGETDKCTMSGTIENQYTVDDLCDGGTINGYGGTVSFMPLDCDYKKWNSSVTYAIDDCVAWNGKFYRSCSSENIDNEPEDDASNVCEPGYIWRLA
jgi:hypothetical protein